MNNKEEVIMTVAVVIGIVAVVVLLWGILVYNNSQNIRRDEYISTHCTKISEIRGGWGGNNYQCGTQK